MSYSYIPAPKSLSAFPKAKLVKSKTPIPGVGFKRKRWADEKFIYEWDYLHGRVEKYDKRGNHLGEFNSITGEQTKPANPKRPKIEP